MLNKVSKNVRDWLCFSCLSFPIEEKGVFFHHGFYSWDGFPKIENREDGDSYTLGMFFDREYLEGSGY